MKNRKSLALAIAIAMTLSTLALVSIPASAAPTRVVALGDDGWISGDTRNAGLIDFVIGPGDPPLGIGSLNLDTPVGADKATLEKRGNFGALSNVEGYYDWYLTSGGPAAPAFKLGIDTPDANPVTGWPGETLMDKILVYEPYLNPIGRTMTTDVWTHDMFDQTTGDWWIVDLTIAYVGVGGPYQTLSEWLADATYGDTLSHPDSEIVSLQFAVGSGNPNCDGNVDNFYISSLGYITDFDYPQGINDENQADGTVSTQVDIATGSGGGIGNEDAPIIKAKWEYVETTYDDDPLKDGLQVAPNLGGSVTIEYFAVVTDPQSVGTVSAIYVDVWHPDGTFKYQFPLTPIYADPLDTMGAENEWNYVWDNHQDLVTINEVWAATLSAGITADYDIWDELHEGIAYIYYGTAELSYCQPGGFYCVGVRGHDSFGNWCNYLLNEFWYIPTSAVEIDFETVDYGSVVTDPDYSDNPKWIGGDTTWDDPEEKATVRNIGNTPVALYVWQNNMGFGTTGGIWDVYFDARLGAPNVDNDNHVIYYPNEFDPGYLGVQIPDPLGLCTMEKLDFSIHVTKGFSTENYNGELKLYAYIEGTPSWATPTEYIDPDPNLGVPDICPCRCP